MANEESTDSATESGEEQVRQFRVHTLYIKDASFEAPNTPQVFREQWTPELGVELRTAAKSIAESDFEVTVSLTVTAKLQSNTAYLVEVHQAGIFGLEGYTDQERTAMLGVHCPQMLFPYACEAAASLVRKGSFPQLTLAPVNFERLFRESQQKTGQPLAS
jgi:preprotein translocase subunit SecB